MGFWDWLALAQRGQERGSLNLGSLIGGFDPQAQRQLQADRAAQAAATTAAQAGSELGTRVSRDTIGLRDFMAKNPQVFGGALSPEHQGAQTVDVNRRLGEENLLGSGLAREIQKWTFGEQKTKAEDLDTLARQNGYMSYDAMMADQANKQFGLNQRTGEFNLEQGGFGLEESKRKSALGQSPAVRMQDGGWGVVGPGGKNTVETTQLAQGLTAADVQMGNERARQKIAGEEVAGRLANTLTNPSMMGGFAGTDPVLLNVIADAYEGVNPELAARLRERAKGLPQTGSLGGSSAPAGFNANAGLQAARELEGGGQQPPPGGPNLGKPTTYSAGSLPSDWTSIIGSQWGWPSGGAQKADSAPPTPPKPAARGWNPAQGKQQPPQGTKQWNSPNNPASTKPGGEASFLDPIRRRISEFIGTSSPELEAPVGRPLNPPSPWQPSLPPLPPVPAPSPGKYVPQPKLTPVPGQEPPGYIPPLPPPPEDWLNAPNRSQELPPGGARILFGPLKGNNPAGMMARMRADYTNQPAALPTPGGPPLPPPGTVPQPVYDTNAPPNVSGMGGGEIPPFLPPQGGHQELIRQLLAQTGGNVARVKQIIQALLNQ